MSDAASDRSEERREIARFLRYSARNEGRRFLRLVLLSLAGAATQAVGLSLLLPLFRWLEVGNLRHSATSPFWMHRIEPALLLYVLAVGAAAWTGRARSIAAARIRLGLVNRIREQIHDAILRMDWLAFQRMRAADLSHVLIGEAARAGAAMEQLALLISSGLVALAMLALAFWMSAAAAAAALLTAVLGAFIAGRTSAGGLVLGREVGRSGRSLNAWVADGLAGLMIVKAFNVEERRRSGFADLVRDLGDRQMAAVADEARRRAVLQLFGAVGVALLLVVAVQIMDLGLSEALVLVLVYARLLIAGLALQESWHRLLQHLPGYSAATSLLAVCRAATEEAHSGSPPPFVDRLRLEQASVRYPDATVNALDHVDAAIPFGSLTALVGPSGSGKSTLGTLLLGLVAPTQGRIYVDDLAIEGDSRAGWRAAVGYVSQDGFLFHDTIRANLSLGQPIDEERLWRALDDAAVAEFVRGLPQGLDTIVGDRGQRLSGGQRQRISLARALLREPRLLLLDEPTSAMDAANEQRILDALLPLRKHRTIVVIAHRWSTVSAADHVILMDGGRVAAAGRWSEVQAAAPHLLRQLDMA